MAPSNHHAQGTSREASASSPNAPVLPHISRRPPASWTTLPHDLKETIFEHYFALFPKAMFKRKGNKWIRDSMRGVEKVWKDTDNDTGLDNDCEEEARLPVESDERGLYVHGGEVPYWTAGRVNKEFDEYIAAKMWTGRELDLSRTSGSRLATFLKHIVPHRGHLIKTVHFGAEFADFTTSTRRGSCTSEESFIEPQVTQVYKNARDKVSEGYSSDEDDKDEDEDGSDSDGEGEGGYKLYHWHAHKSARSTRILSGLPNVEAVFLKNPVAEKAYHQGYINVLSTTSAPITTLSIWTSPRAPFPGNRLALFINPQKSLKHLKILCQCFYTSTLSPVLDAIALLPYVETVDVVGPGLYIHSSADPVPWKSPYLCRLYLTIRGEGNRPCDYDNLLRRLPPSLVDLDVKGVNPEYDEDDDSPRPDFSLLEPYDFPLLRRVSMHVFSPPAQFSLFESSPLIGLFLYCGDMDAWDVNGEGTSKGDRIVERVIQVGKMMRREHSTLKVVCVQWLEWSWYIEEHRRGIEEGLQGTGLRVLLSGQYM